MRPETLALVRPHVSSRRETSCINNIPRPVCFHTIQSHRDLSLRQILELKIMSLRSKGEGDMEGCIVFQACKSPSSLTLSCHHSHHPETYAILDLAELSSWTIWQATSVHSVPLATTQILQQLRIRAQWVDRVKHRPQQAVLITAPVSLSTAHRSAELLTNAAKAPKPRLAVYRESGVIVQRCHLIELKGRRRLH